MHNKDFYAQLLQQVSTGDLVAELHRRGYSYQPKDKSTAKQDTTSNFISLGRTLLLFFIFACFCLLSYMAYVSSLIG